ncbi:protein-tyrosine phosphatase family protein [Paenibacillus cymbidii]|uniref:protein-tyrosine phosphatase family protein n=1 Tax=Paenibacillus cymbidii TaxID=1639034 RepID=UPI001080F3F5|nr:tyrosine-protein phosphatase [Paenibacillus cymbidii]
MTTEKNYHALVPDRIFMGAADDVEAMVINEAIDVIVDLRGDATACAYPGARSEWIQIPLADQSGITQEEGFRQAIAAITRAFGENKKVAFHCNGGRGRTGAVAAGTLIALGLAQTVVEAEAKAKAIRSEIEIKPMQRESLDKLFS